MTDKLTPREKISDLVNRIEAQYPSYKNSDYKKSKVNVLIYQLYGFIDEEIKFVFMS